MTPLQAGFGDLAEVLVPAVVRLLGLVLAAGGAAAAGAVVYRWYVREPLSDGLAVLFAVGVVGVYLNTVGLFGQVLDPVTGESPFAARAVVSNVSALLGGALAAPVGRRLGDRVALSVFDLAGDGTVEGGLGRLRDRLGSATAVELPPAEAVEDIAGYDPVADAVRERLGGRTVALPRGPGTVDERLAAHLRSTYGVGRVDVDVADGTATYLALGTRPAGIAPTLAAGTVAVAVRGDPPNGASPGDLLQVYPDAGTDEGDDRRPVATAELRATAGDVVTLAVDEGDAAALSTGGPFRLVTLPARAHADREFAALLSAADERMDALTVADGSPLAGTTVADLGATVAAVRTAGGDLDPIPSRDRPLAAGETVYVVASPETVRRLTERASAA